MMFWYFIIGIIGAFICAGAASSRGRSSFGWFLYGLLLWPLALIHVLVLPKNQAAVERRQIASGSARACPHCAETIKPKAIVCKHCHREVEAVAAEKYFS